MAYIIMADESKEHAEHAACGDDFGGSISAIADGMITAWVSTCRHLKKMTTSVRNFQRHAAHAKHASLRIFVRMSVRSSVHMSVHIAVHAYRQS